MIFDTIYCEEKIHEKRQKIAMLLQQQSNSFFNGRLFLFNENDLIALFSLYDQFFFDNWFRIHNAITLTFRYNGRLTSSAGLTKVTHASHSKNPKKWLYEIHISKPLLFNFKPGGSKTKINGRIPSCQLEALQLILEHEICHVIEFLCLGKSNCNTPAFRALAQRLFGHTDVVHTLSHRQHPVPYSFRAGESVCFNWKGNRLQGIISRITKRATVMVPDFRGEYVDYSGIRYRKYYVPLSQLQPCKE